MVVARFAVSDGHASVVSRLTEQQFASFPPIVQLTGYDLSALRACVALADAFAPGDGSKRGADDSKPGK